MRGKLSILKDLYRLSRYTDFLKELESDEMQSFWSRVSAVSKKLSDFEGRMASACKKIDTLFPDVDTSSECWFSTDIRYLKDGIVTNVTLHDGTIRTEFKPYKNEH